MTKRSGCCLLLLYNIVSLLILLGQHATSAITRVHYGYFPEASPIRVACARGWFTYMDYHVTCYPQTSGGYAASRLDSGSLHLAELGSTPLGEALARGVDIQVVYIDQYKGDSQGIYVRPDNDANGYKGVEHPFDLIGRKLGVPFGSTMHYQVLFMLDIFDMTGKVELLNLSPQEIVSAWDDEAIDAAACWGQAREHIFDEGANELVSAGVLADWGRETFNVVATRRDFLDRHRGFVSHFVSILGILTDSFIDKLGEFDSNNTKRWNPNKDINSTYIPSLADTIMKSGEEAGNPSIEFITSQRHALDLPKQLSSADQLSCDYLGGGQACRKPSLQHIAIQQTAQFLMDQKVIHSMGQLSVMGDASSCSESNTLCGSDIVTSGSLDPTLYLLGTWDGLEPFYALNETGRAEEGQLSAGDSDCGSTRLSVTQATQYFGDLSRSRHSNSLVGQSYSDNLNCWWIISNPDYISDEYAVPDDLPDHYVVLDFLQVRVWSGDFIRIYSDPSGECNPDRAEDLALMGKITGLNPELPTFKSKGCILIHFETDSNQERSYNDIQNQGDGFIASTYAYASTTLPSSCTGEQWGADCSFTKHCLGTSHIDIDTAGSRYSVSSGVSSTLYPNDLDCSWEIQTKGSPNYVAFTVNYDLEPTHDYLELSSGPSTGGTLYALLSAESTQHTYYIPTDVTGLATIRLVTDDLGRRRGFNGDIYLGDRGQPREDCPAGKSGLFCEFPHCITTNDIGRHPLGSSSSDLHPDYQIGRVVSQTQELSVPANIDCTWPLENTLGDSQGIRLRFNSPLDLEPQSASAVGDKIVVFTNAATNTAAEIFVEKCTTDEVCSFRWQTGKCEAGACTVRQSIDINIDNFYDAEFHLVTDRSDGGKAYNGLDFDALFVSSCPAEFGNDAHCEDGAGKCVDGACVCGEENIPCNCPCDVDRVVSSVNTTLLWAVLVPLVVVFIVVFVWYRRRRLKKSRAQKTVIQDKEEQLEAFRNSVVGMRSATTHYMPKTVEASDDTSQDSDNLMPLPPPQKKIQWCWKETAHMMSNHAPDMIVGNPADCWIKYDVNLNSMIENAYQAYGDSKKDANFKTSVNYSFKKLTAFSPFHVDESNFIVCKNGYKIDVREMKQIKEATNFQRDIQRIVEVSDPETAPEDKMQIDLSEVEVGNALPDELCSEPQMVLVKGDIIQISSQRPDGWAFGTKLHHMDEATARELVRLTSKGSAEANIFTDTGWFPLDLSEIPTGEELALLESKVGNTDALQAPAYWDDIVDPTVVQFHKLKKGDDEYDRITTAFMSTLKPPRFSKNVKIIGVERIQNLAMWQSYVVKRQTICYRETGGQRSNISDQDMKRALDRAERTPLWHGTNVEVMNKIMQQGFNRSFCGKNATVYGKGVYFARDAEYSAHSIYSVPDKKNVQYMMACRVIVGEYCPGARDALTPDVRDSTTQTLYDTTVGLLSNDTMDSPSIYVTYHDAQAYPEYLIKFKSS